MVPQLLAQKHYEEAMFGEDRGTRVQGDAIVGQLLSMNRFVRRHYEMVKRGNEVLEGLRLGGLWGDDVDLEECSSGGDGDGDGGGGQWVRR